MSHLRTAAQACGKQLQQRGVPCLPESVVAAAIDDAQRPSGQPGLSFADLLLYAFQLPYARESSVVNLHFCSTCAAVRGALVNVLLGR